MFTNEFDHDEISITILDDYANHEDVNFLLYDDLVYIRQWDEDSNTYVTITMSPDMFDEFAASMFNPEGAYVSYKKNK